MNTLLILMQDLITNYDSVLSDSEIDKKKSQAEELKEIGKTAFDYIYYKNSLICIIDIRHSIKEFGYFEQVFENSDTVAIHGYTLGLYDFVNPITYMKVMCGSKKGEDIDYNKDVQDDIDLAKTTNDIYVIFDRKNKKVIDYYVGYENKKEIQKIKELYK